jgi:hypothetical protein
MILLINANPEQSLALYCTLREPLTMQISTVYNSWIRMTL